MIPHLVSHLWDAMCIDYILMTIIKFFVTSNIVIQASLAIQILNAEPYYSFKSFDFYGVSQVNLSRIFPQSWAVANFYPATSEIWLYYVVMATIEYNRTAKNSLFIFSRYTY
jgi:hypothetical protein